MIHTTFYYKFLYYIYVYNIYVYIELQIHKLFVNTIKILYYIIIYCFIKIEKILCDRFFLDSEH